MPEWAAALYQRRQPRPTLNSTNKPYNVIEVSGSLITSSVSYSMTDYHLALD